MRLSTVFAAALTLAATAVALPYTGSDSLAPRGNGADALNHGHEPIIRGAAVLDARAKYRAGAYSLTTRGMKRGRAPTAADLDDGKRAMCAAGVTQGFVEFGWHDGTTATTDPLNHFTITPTGADKGKGRIHVRADGSWTQGTNGKFKGKPC